eukprot:3329724-Rhodomonas_salina.1
MRDNTSSPLVPKRRVISSLDFYATVLSKVERLNSTFSATFVTEVEVYSCFVDVGSRPEPRVDVCCLRHGQALSSTQSLPLRASLQSQALDPEISEVVTWSCRQAGCDKAAWSASDSIPINAEQDCIQERAQRQEGTSKTPAVTIGDGHEDARSIRVLLGEDSRVASRLSSFTLAAYFSDLLSSRRPRFLPVVLSRHVRSAFPVKDSPQTACTAVASVLETACWSQGPLPSFCLRTRFTMSDADTMTSIRNRGAGGTASTLLPCAFADHALVMGVYHEPSATVAAYRWTRGRKRGRRGDRRRE